MYAVFVIMLEKTSQQKPLPFISVTDRSLGALAVTETPDRSFGSLAGVASFLRMMLYPITVGMLTP